ncbi:hypothetical protein FOYG_16833 [Fusarium oxysporum NRRL 32931]|uniref:Uncharacterized protein n=1 Tax=Fusarium oxysporum NRRL 32931 TaxID=660029 RepID=W9HIN0_FUSOX|nr:hypothetical protein FOYG_16833 [Fusarium oxysporum NRRL 32931]
MPKQDFHYYVHYDLVSPSQIRLGQLIVDINDPCTPLAHDNGEYIVAVQELPCRNRRDPDDSLSIESKAKKGSKSDKTPRRRKKARVPKNAEESKDGETGKKSDNAQEKQDISRPKDELLANISFMPVSLFNNTEQSGSTSHTETSIFLRAVQFLKARFKHERDRAAFESILADIDQLDTYTINPSDSYVTKSLEQPDVQNYLKKRLMRKHVFMVTTVKIARKGAKLELEQEVSQTDSTEENAGGGTGKASAGGSIKHGEASFHLTKKSLRADSDFVYAFGVRKCFITWRGEVSKKVETKDAVLSGAPLRPEAGGSSALPAPEAKLEFMYRGLGSQVKPSDLGSEAANWEAVAFDKEDEIKVFLSLPKEAANWEAVASNGEDGRKIIQDLPK